MKRIIRVPALLLAFTMIAIWLCGLVTGWSLGIAKADQCSGYSGPFFSQSNCDGQQCTSFQIFGFWSTQCTDPVAPPPQP